MLSCLSIFEVHAQTKFVGWGAGSLTFGLNTGIDSVRAIAAAVDHTVILKNDGKVLTLGEFKINYPWEAMPANLHDIKGIATGSENSAAIKSDGTVVVWGNSINSNLNTVPAGLDNVKQVAIGWKHIVALKHDGGIVTWGDNLYGQTNVPPGLSGVISISACYNHTLALKSDGTIAAWGENTANVITVPSGLTGVVEISTGFGHSLARKADGTIVKWGTEGIPELTPPVGLTDVKQMASGIHCSYALKTDGTVVGWGQNTNQAIAVPPGLTDVVSISAGSFRGMALKRNGTIVAWGFPSGASCVVPPLIKNAIAIDASWSHSVALESDGTVKAWGINVYGQATVPPGLTNVVAVSAGGQTTLCLKSDGKVVGFGQEPDPGFALTDVKQVSAGDEVMVALKTDGTVVAWGDWTISQIPDGLNNVVEVSAGNRHIVALKADGTVVTWGEQTEGPLKVPEGLNNVKSIAAGNVYTVALKYDGTVVSWGGINGAHYQIPAGTMGVTAISAGGDRAMLLKMDGTFLISGDDTTADKISSQLIQEGFSNIVRIAAGGGYLALTGSLPARQEKTVIVKGNLFRDPDFNCIPNLNGQKAKGFVVKAVPGSFYAMSDSNGDYTLHLPVQPSPVQFIISGSEYTFPDFQAEVICPSPNWHAVVADTFPDTMQNKNFGYHMTECHRLEVQITSLSRRRCFRNTTSVTYSNKGALVAPASFVLVEFPHYVRPVKSSVPYVVVNDSLWRFDLGDIGPMQSGSFIITDSVICGLPEILGSTQCTKATIYPAPDCTPNGAWDGAQIRAAGTCVNGVAQIGLYNDCLGNMFDSVSYWVYLDSIQVKTGNVWLASGDSLKMNVVSNGMSVTLVANQVPNNSTGIFVSVTVESCGATTFSRINVNNFPRPQLVNIKTDCREIRGSYDPNDKQAFPTGFSSTNTVPLKTTMDYLIRFQNTGTDTAFTVFVSDTLSDYLDPETIELGASSHAYKVGLRTYNFRTHILDWKFDHINLPDSGTNQLASHGFIQFWIRPRKTIPPGSQVRNQAAIYFDFNPPVLTNQTLTTFDNVIYTDPTLNNHVQIILPTQTALTSKQIGVKLYPNPVTQNQLTASFSTKGSLILYDAKGQIVYQKDNLEGIQTLPIRLKTGFYFARIATQKGSSTEKVVVLE